MSIPKEMPYDEEFMFFGVKAKDMTRVELLQMIKHLASSMQHYRKSAEEKADELVELYKQRGQGKSILIL